MNPIQPRSIEDVVMNMPQKERDLIADFNLRGDQLRNIRQVINSATPKKAAKLEADVLPGYIVREYNAREKATKMMAKKGLRLK